MKFTIVRNVCLRPKQIVSEKPDQLKEKLKKPPHHSIYLNQVTTSLAENSLSQYMSFLQNDVKLNADMFKQFSPTVNHLDDFFFNNVEVQLPNEFVSIFKIVMIPSHRQLSVILKDNMKCESVNARKTIIDQMKSKGLAHTVPVTKDLLHSVKLSISRYQGHLRQQIKESKGNETATQLSLLNANIKEIELRKKALIDFCDSMDKELLKLAKKDEKKQDLNLPSKGTALKRKAVEKRPEISVLESGICALIIKKQKLKDKRFFFFDSFWIFNFRV